MSVDLWAMSSEINFPKCSLMYSSRSGTFLSFLQKDFGNKDLTRQKQQGEKSKILQHSPSYFLEHLMSVTMKSSIMGLLRCRYNAFHRNMVCSFQSENGALSLTLSIGILISPGLLLELTAP